MQIITIFLLTGNNNIFLPTKGGNQDINSPYIIKIVSPKIFRIWSIPNKNKRNYKM